MKYSLDVWHAAKNLAKDLRAAAAKRGCKKLGEWISSVKNHFWRCASVAKGDRDMFMVRIVENHTKCKRVLSETMHIHCKLMMSEL